jgi:hypothetical protein
MITKGFLSFSDDDDNNIDNKNNDNDNAVYLKKIKSRVTQNA